MTDEAREQGWMVLALFAFLLGLLLGAATCRADETNWNWLEGRPITPEWQQYFYERTAPPTINEVPPIGDEISPTINEVPPLGEVLPSLRDPLHIVTPHQTHRSGPVCLILDENNNIISLASPEECKND